MDNFLEILQGVNENSFQYKKQLIVYQAYMSRRYVCGGMWSLLSFDYNRTSTTEEFLGVKCWVNKGVSY